MAESFKVVTTDLFSMLRLKAGLAGFALDTVG